MSEAWAELLMDERKEGWINGQKEGWINGRNKERDENFFRILSYFKQGIFPLQLAALAANMSEEEFLEKASLRDQN